MARTDGGGGGGTTTSKTSQLLTFDELIQQKNVKSNLVPKDDLFDGGDPAKPATQKRKLIPKEEEEIQLILPEDAGSISCMSAKKVSEMFPAQQILSWKLRLKISFGLS